MKVVGPLAVILKEKAQKSALQGQLVRRDVCSFEQKKLILHEYRKRQFESKNQIAAFQPYGLYSSWANKERT
jgi:hypothetical protein